jgi:hypothetical protein
MPITAEKRAVGENRAAREVGRLLRKHATKGIFLSRLGEGRHTVNISIRFLGGNVEITALDEFMWVNRTDNGKQFQMKSNEFQELCHRLPEAFSYQPLFGMRHREDRAKAASTRALLDNLAYRIADNPRGFGLQAVQSD